MKFTIKYNNDDTCTIMIYSNEFIPKDWLFEFPLLVMVEEADPRLGFMFPPLLLEGWAGDNSWALSLSLSLPGRKDSSSCSTLSSVGPHLW